jgi:hypothetical protein
MQRKKIVQPGKLHCVIDLPLNLFTILLIFCLQSSGIVKFIAPEFVQTLLFINKIYATN